MAAGGLRSIDESPYLDDATAKKYWYNIKDLKFHVVEVVNPFCVVQKLSHLNIQHKKVGCTLLEAMVDFNADILTKCNQDKSVDDAMKPLLLLLKQKKKIRMNSDKNYVENTVLRELISTLLQHLSSSITLEHTLHSWVKAIFEDSNKISCGHLGLGCNKTTWYGTIDGRIRGYLQQSGSTSVIAGDTDDDDEESGSDSTIMEVKKENEHESQGIGTVVLSSFIEQNLHPTLNTLVPCLLLNCFTVQIYLYDSASDVLLISERFSFRRGNVVSKESALLLWLFINHRLFLKTISKTSNTIPPSRIKHFLSLGNTSLSDFQALTEKEIYWNPGASGYSSCTESLDDDDISSHAEIWKSTDITISTKRRKI